MTVPMSEVKLLNDHGPRLCPSCRRLLPGTREYFYAIRYRLDPTTGYLGSKCKTCKVADGRRQEHATRMRVGSRAINRSKRQEGYTPPRYDDEKRKAVQRRCQGWRRFRRDACSDDPRMVWCTWCCFAPSKVPPPPGSATRRRHRYPTRCPRCGDELEARTERLREAVQIMERRARSNGWTLARTRPLWLIQYEWLRQHRTPPKGWTPPLAVRCRTRAQAQERADVESRARGSRCWASPENRDDSCLLPYGHHGPHRWTPSRDVCDATSLSEQTRAERRPR